jgi:hypothetical protein
MHVIVTNWSPPLQLRFHCRKQITTTPWTRRRANYHNNVTILASLDPFIVVQNNSYEKCCHRSIKKTRIWGFPLHSPPWESELARCQCIWPIIGQILAWLTIAAKSSSIFICGEIRVSYLGRKEDNECVVCFFSRRRVTYLFCVRLSRCALGVVMFHDNRRGCCDGFCLIFSNPTG